MKFDDIFGIVGRTLTPAMLHIYSQLDTLGQRRATAPDLDRFVLTRTPTPVTSLTPKSAVVRENVEHSTRGYPRGRC